MLPFILLRGTVMKLETAAAPITQQVVTVRLVLEPDVRRHFFSLMITFSLCNMSGAASLKGLQKKSHQIQAKLKCGIFRLGKKLIPVCLTGSPDAGLFPVFIQEDRKLRISRSLTGSPDRRFLHKAFH
uniref:Uncharacterized protein n=1 Tax=Poecilia reticulata TaxID=8081 RepID=A0A3P9PCM3_POERE